MQKAIVFGLMLGTLGLLWWAALVFYFEGDYYSFPRISIALVVGALVSFACSLKDTGDKDRAERWYLSRDEL